LGHRLALIVGFLPIVERTTPIPGMWFHQARASDIFDKLTNNFGRLRDLAGLHRAFR
jgi:hypothetical protein